MSHLSKQDRLNSKKQKAKDDKKSTKPSSGDKLFLEDPAPDSTAPSQEPVDPLVQEKYTQRLHTEVRAGPSAQPSPPSPLPCALASAPLYTPSILQMLSACCIHDGSRAALVKGTLVCQRLRE